VPFLRSVHVWMRHRLVLFLVVALCAKGRGHQESRSANGSDGQKHPGDEHGRAKGVAYIDRKTKKEVEVYGAGRSWWLPPA